jgi:hypothetical protein
VRSASGFGGGALHEAATTTSDTMTLRFLT